MVERQSSSLSKLSCQQGFWGSVLWRAVALMVVGCMGRVVQAIVVPERERIERSVERITWRAMALFEGRRGFRYRLF